MLSELVSVSAAPRGRWNFEFGDMNGVAWFTVGAYVVASMLALRAHVSARQRARQFAAIDRDEMGNQRRLAKFWALVVVLTLALGVNKQLDLQTLVIRTVRQRAVRDGWYDQRRERQVEFILVIALLGTTTTLVLAFWLRRVLSRIWLAVAGVGMMLSFVVIRAASFHYVDAVLGLGTIRLNWVIELGGIALIGLSSMIAVRSGAPTGNRHAAPVIASPSEPTRREAPAQ